jgi:ABC-type polysaccharide/polyol phosphate transport system ATPase subunit
MYDLEFHSVSKRYRVVGQSGSSSGFSRKLRWLASRSQDFWALRDVSFAVRSGEALGIIGHNGAGKSTVLKLVSNITSPTEGEIRIRGRIAALLEVGSGFHPELTGRENVYLSGSILGMRRAEINNKLDSILEFAGVRNFADVAVKRYSSGMYVRLGFAIAAHLDADILLLDEVLAVGDAKFQERCQERILELKANGTTIVFISHDLASVRRLCDRGVLLNHGRLIGEGTPAEVISQYTLLGRERNRLEETELLNSQKPARVTAFTFLNESGLPTTELQTGFPVRAIVEYEVTRPIHNAAVSVLFYASGDWTVASHFTTIDVPLHLPPGTGAIEFSTGELTLPPGAYAAGCSIEDDRQQIDFVSKTYFAVMPGQPIRGRFHSPHTWRELRFAETVSDEGSQARGDEKP